MPIGEALEKAFRYPWKNKALIFYGVIITLFTGSYGIRNNFNYSVNSEDVFFTKYLSWFASEQGAIVALLILVILMILGVLITAWAQAAIINGVQKIEQGKDVRRKEIGKISRQMYRRLIMLNIVIPAAVFVMVIMVALGIAVAVYSLPSSLNIIVGVLIGLLAVVALVPALIYLGIAWPLAVRNVVLGEAKALESIKLALIQIKGRFWWTFGFAIVLSIIAAAASAIVGIPVAATVAGALYFYSIGKSSLLCFLLILTVIFFVPYLLVAGYFQSFIQTGWTIWWLKLRESSLVQTKKKTERKVAKAK